MFAANLQLPADVSLNEKEELVSSILKKLGLEQTRDTMIGYSGKLAANSQLKRGISGGG